MFLVVSLTVECLAHSLVFDVVAVTGFGPSFPLPLAHTHTHTHTHTAFDGRQVGYTTDAGGTVHNGTEALDGPMKQLKVLWLRGFVPFFPVI